MPSRSLFIAIATTLLTATAPVAAGAICTAAQIIAQEGNSCPAGTGDCVIAGKYTIDTGCTIDFGTRKVTLLSNSRLTIGLMDNGVSVGTAHIRAGELIVHSMIDGVGGINGARGGLLRIDLVRDFQVSNDAKIDVSGNSSAGEVIIIAGGNGFIQGQVKAQFLNIGASGGLIDITTGGNLTTTLNSVLNAAGGSDSDGGGEIDLSAGGNLSLAAPLNVTGLDGGFVGLSAAGKITVLDLDASGTGDAGIGGCVDLLAGAGIDVQGSLLSHGSSGEFGGGCGGLVCLDGGFGDVTVAPSAIIDADGASPDGGGGQITLLARGSAIINGQLQARGPTGETCGGDLCVDTGYDITVGVDGELDVSGGDSGGEVELLASRNLAVNRAAADSTKVTINASGRASGSLGGDITLHAGQQGSGSLTLNAALDVGSNAPCSEENGCGEAGSNELVGCNVNLTTLAAMHARGPSAGENDLIARQQLTVRGTLDALRTRAAGNQGLNRYVHRIGTPPLVLGASVQPAAVTLPVTTCPEEGDTQPPCLKPCPACGNGAIEFPEECDAGALPPHSCSGCSIYCRLEQCDDGLFCTGDTCDPLYGCLSRPTPFCREPTRTATGTPPTATSTPTLTATPSQTDTVSASPSATPTATRTATVSATATASASATGTASSTATESSTPTATATAVDSATPTVTVTVTATPTATATATASVTATSTSTATASATASTSSTPTAAPPACVGDCTGDGQVIVSELITGVNIALTNLPISSCPAFDRNGDRMVTVNELIAAVGAALNGC